jgi:hypothetical protein
VTRILAGVAALVAGVGAPLLSACGGSAGLQLAAALDEGGRDGGFEASTVRTDASVEVDAMTVAPIRHTSAEASTRCKINPNPGGGGVAGPTPACTIIWEETCDGMPYYATCACPQGTCSCVGQTTTVVNNFNDPGCADDCTAVSASAVFALCGFPQ